MNVVLNHINLLVLVFESRVTGTITQWDLNLQNKICCSDTSQKTILTPKYTLRFSGQYEKNRDEILKIYQANPEK